MLVERTGQLGGPRQHGAPRMRWCDDVATITPRGGQPAARQARLLGGSARAGQSNVASLADVTAVSSGTPTNLAVLTGRSCLTVR